MPQNQDIVIGSEVTPEQYDVFEQAYRDFTTAPTLAAVAKLTGPVLVTNELPPNLAGAYQPANDTLAITGKSATSGEALNLLIHEFTHRAQNQPGARTAPTLEPQYKQSATDSNIDYGPGEAAAWVVANMIYAPERKFNPQVLSFIDKNRAEANRIFAEGVNPHLPKQQHMKAYQEMNLVEKALNAVIGYQPTLPTPTDTLPPWVESAISEMKKYSNGN